MVLEWLRDQPGDHQHHRYQMIAPIDLESPQPKRKGWLSAATKADRFEIRPFFYSRILYVIINLHPIAI